MGLRCAGRIPSDRRTIRTPRKIETAAALFIVIALTAFCAFAVNAALAEPTPSTGPTVNVGQPEVQTVKPCTVGFTTYNKLVTKYDALTGKHRFKRRNQPVPCAAYRKIKREVKEARADCWRASQLTGSSYYGYHDSGGLQGACGDYLTSPSATNTFAILASGDVTSRCGQVFWFTVGHKWYRGHQADTGSGGGGIGGHARTFDFWNPPDGGGLARALNLTTAGLAVVRYSRHNCGA